MLFDVLLFIFVCYRYQSLQPVIRARHPSPYGLCPCPRRCLSDSRCLVVVVVVSLLYVKPYTCRQWCVAKTIGSVPADMLISKKEGYVICAGMERQKVW